MSRKEPSFRHFLRWALSLVLTIQILFPYKAFSYDDDHESGDDRDLPGVLCIGRCEGEGGYEDGRDRDDGGNQGGGGHADYDEQSPDDHNDHGEGGEWDRDDRDRRDDDHSAQNGDRNDRNNAKYGERGLQHGDRDRGDGVIFVRDQRGNVYYRGEPAWVEETDQGDFYHPDHRDLYFDTKNNVFVKSVDQSRLLPLDGLKVCVANDSCVSKGYRADWWNYSQSPDFENGEQAGDWLEVSAFYEKQFEIKKQLNKAYSNPAVRSSSAKYAVLREADFLHGQARQAYIQSRREEAEALQRGAKELAFFLTDVGISVSPLGWAKDAYELITGTRLIDGKKLTDGERLAAGIGVMMPGVAGLAFAGMKIIARNPLTRQGISKAIVEVEKIGELLGDLKPVRFKEGRNTAEVAIIGRDMNYVKEAEGRLQSAGLKTRTFTPSTAAKDDLAADFARNGNKLVGYDDVPSTQVYKEDMAWTDKVLQDDISVVDIGNPSHKKEASRFYDDEVRKIFGAKK